MVVCVISSASSAFQFNESNNNHENTNAGSSVHLCQFLIHINLASWQKMILIIWALVVITKMTIKTKALKRKGNLFKEICSVENLNASDMIARKGKSKQYGIKIHDKNSVENIELLHKMLLNKTYSTSSYTTFKIYDPKERDIFRLPYYPDRIVHHAIMRVLEPIFVSTFISNTYSCIKKRGIHAAANEVKESLKDEQGTTYCLKLDIKKFYPNVNHDILKQLLRRKFKDKELLWLLDEIIESADGLPIGNYMSQFLANFYLCYFDHWIKEEKKVKYYFRYADDLVVLSNDKQYLHKLLADIREYLTINLKLTIKGNYQIFPVESRGIDFVGYVFRHGYTRLRKSIKQNFCRMMVNNPNQKSIASYNGWLKHGDCKHLQNKILNGSKEKV